MRSRRIVAALAAVALGVHLYGLYRVTGPPTPPWFTHADKLEHVVGFALPVLLVLLSLRLRRRDLGVLGSDRRTVLVVAGIFALHAVVSELVQHFFYTARTGDPYDVVADVSGVVLGVLGYRAAARITAPAAVPA